LEPALALELPDRCRRPPAILAPARYSQSLTVFDPRRGAIHGIKIRTVDVRIEMLEIGVHQFRAIAVD